MGRVFLVFFDLQPSTEFAEKTSKVGSRSVTDGHFLGQAFTDGTVKVDIVAFHQKARIADPSVIVCEHLAGE